MKIEKEINKLKNNLIKKSKKSGLYENFGQKEIRFLQDKYFHPSIEISNQINEFNNWCMTYNG